MSPKLDSPVQTQMAVAVLKSPLSGEYHGNRRMEGKQPAGRRRVFVQTETGCVFGMELDRGDNAHTVKRRLQLALKVPTEESCLTFGDMKLIYSCLSPTGKEVQQRDQSGLIEILGQSNSFSKMKQLIKESVKAIKMGVDPIPVHSGLGGAYYFRNSRGESVAIVKPTDEEPFAPNNPKGFVGKALGQPGLKRSVRVGETGFREVAAYLLDYDHFANVPPTSLVKITHSIFNVNDGVNGNKPHKKKQVSKIASLQQFIPHDFDASDHGTSSFPVSAVHRIGILDVRILNTDRHAGNLLVRKLDRVGRFGQVELIPIDHGLCLPETLEDPYFEWIHWPQASIPFSDDELEYIQKLNPGTDCDMLRSELPMIREACLRVLVLCTIFLKEAAAAGLCLAEIGEMMSRDFRAGRRNPVSLRLYVLRLGGKEGFAALPLAEISPTMSKLSISLENSTLGDKKQKCQKLSGAKPENGYFANTSSGHRSANEQLPASMSFVKLTDISEEEWTPFLDKFQELLYPAFAKRKSVTLGQRQIQRLGTSCKF
ncbi:hypothetical protein GH714_040974 [Hevea brasiliensis]|uniref:1-phosphatidylinositol 4-kinase n=1 Tax=Hevea brasiliensis TaxID=3981 RepID=A0A6A6N981_HEVBR|nr:hypothetical protein GH714_040974 [Hevea brasiliensis]